MSLRPIISANLRHARHTKLFHTPLSVSSQPDNIGRLCKSLNEFSLSPLEASLTAQYFQMNAVSHHIKDLRLPSLDKNINLIQDSPIPNINPIIDPCGTSILEKFDPFPHFEIEEPPTEVIKKEAAKLIGIRKRGMKKHKLRKLRKRMKYVYMKRSQKREYAKELLFQKTQMDKIRHAEAFDAVEYVRDKLDELKRVPIPTTWNYRKLPPQVIKNLMKDKYYYNPQNFPHFSYYRRKAKEEEEAE